MTASTRSWLTLAEVAEATGLCERTVRRKAAAGHLPAYRVAGGRTLRFRAEDVDGLMAPVPSASNPAAAGRPRAGEAGR